MYHFFGKLIFPISILFTKRIKICWFRDISNTQDAMIYCLNKYCTKIRKEKKLELFPKIFEL